MEPNDEIGELVNEYNKNGAVNWMKSAAALPKANGKAPGGDGKAGSP